MDPENEDIEVEIVDENEQTEVEEPVVEGDEQSDSDDEVEEPVLFDDAEPAQVADVAAQLEELKRLRAQAKAAPVQNTPSVKQLGKKPKLEDFDFDAPKFEAAIDEWHTTKAEIDRETAAAQAEQQAAQAEFERTVKRYNDSKASIGADDYDAVELLVQDALDLTQQGVLIQGSEHAAKLVYALGRSKTKLAELAKIKNPIKFAFAIAKLESELMAKQGKVGKVNTPAPESGKPKSGSTGTGGGSASDRQLERLRAEALKTGDVSKVVKFKRQLKARKTG